ncbi:MAG: pilus assembly protein TadB [Oscillospiraceae bacterium]|nr:pilus assembly protein TadB [Oscillospiraceae bacterium]
MSDEFCNYNEYRMSRAELLLSAAAAMLAVFFATYVFYRSIALCAVISPLGLFYLPYRRKRQIAKRREALKQQFRDMLYSLSSSLMAGKTMESALREVRGDLEVIYPDPETAIIREVDIILRRTLLNETVDAALYDLAERSGIEDIESFCDVLSTCRKMGGNLVEIVKNTTNILGDKMEIKNEIDVLLAQRRFEKKVLNIMPVALILVLSLTAKDYIEPVFSTLVGKLVMSVSIALIALSWLISEKIMNIDV